MKVITHKRLLGLERIAYLTPMAENCKIESCTSGITSATSLPLSKSCSRSGAGHTGTYASTAVSDFDHGQAIIRHLVRERLVNLFSDPVNLVRRSLMETGGLIKLAGFLGRSWTNDTLLSHMVTFLNDKNDPGLRAAFFQQIGPLACLAGSQCVAVLRPLLEQGLLDPSECVLEACLHALTHLLYRRLLGPVYSLSFLNQCLCLTSHPTMRIRQAAVAFIALTTRQALGPLLGSGDCGKWFLVKYSHLCKQL
ncbi:unnamed protein product [Protopolystoma xenopodis]|uniref:Phosphatase 2A Regulatory Subunit A helical domain-containing protein n=1 Tax=Protopolystoma xenopodis TaxID=117903 RepID=A0A3S5BRL2_9PLAT|nr:unnamed protein product [Protopolystoma xenopodis]